MSKRDVKGILCRMRGVGVIVGRWRLLWVELDEI